MWWSGALSDEQQAIVSSIDALAATCMAPSHCAAWDSTKSYPHDAMAALAANDWSRLAVAEKFGGAGASAADLAIVHQALARHSLAVAQAYYSLWVLGAEAIDRLGSEEQQQEWLPRIADGTARIAFALTEPGSGSDASALRTHAKQSDDGWLVNGQKLFITGALVADRIVTAVRTASGGRPRNGITLLMIDPHEAGVTCRPLDKVGLRAIDLCEVFLDDVHVPETAVLGSVGSAWRDLRAGLAKERLYLAAICAGALCDLVGRSVDYATEREAFGRNIGSHQMVAERIVRMRVAADAAAGLVKEAASLIDAEVPGAEVAAAAAKLFASEAYVSGAREAVQVFGGYGFTEDYPVARHYRDCKYLEIGGGTSQIQTIVLARAMGLAI